MIRELIRKNNITESTTQLDIDNFINNRLEKALSIA